MEAFLERLESVTTRLEKHERGSRVVDQAAKAASAHTQAPASVAAPASAARASGPAVSAARAVENAHPASGLAAACDKLASEQVAALATAAAALPQEFQPSSINFVRGVNAMLDIVKASQLRAKPRLEEWQLVAKDLAECLSQAQHIAGGPRKPSTNHDKALSENMQGLLWVTHDCTSPGLPRPGNAIADALSSSEMYLNRVLMEFRQTAPEHKVWVTAVKEAMLAIEALASSRCPVGIVWTAALAEGPAPAAAPAAPRAAPAGGPPPPPPPPKPGVFFEDQPKATTSSAGSQAELMAALNRGSGITSGLKKVTADMKTKNRADRTGTVQATQPSVAAQSAQPTRGPPRKVLTQNRWQIENYAGGDPVELPLEEVKRDQTLYIAHCTDTVIQVKGKVNSVMMDACKKVGIVFEAVVASFEAVNCSALEIQCTGSCPCLSIDKTDGVQIYLPEASAADTEILTAKASAVNVSVLRPPEAEADPADYVVPEQFRSTLANGKLVTNPVTHG